MSQCARQLYWRMLTWAICKITISEMTMRLKSELEKHFKAMRRDITPLIALLLITEVSETKVSAVSSTNVL